MEVEYVYRMSELAGAVACIRKLDLEPPDLLGGLGLVLLLGDDGDLEWYVYGTFENPKPADRVRAVEAMEAHGRSTNLSFDKLRQCPRLGFVASGSFSQIAEALRQLAARSSDRVKAGILSALNSPPQE